MQAVLSELTLREIDHMNREELLEAFDGFAEVCRHQPPAEKLHELKENDLRQLVCEARRQYRVRGY